MCKDDVVTLQMARERGGVGILIRITKPMLDKGCPKQRKVVWRNLWGFQEKFRIIFLGFLLTFPHYFKQSFKTVCKFVEIVKIYSKRSILLYPVNFIFTFFYFQKTSKQFFFVNGEYQENWRKFNTTEIVCMGLLEIFHDTFLPTDLLCVNAQICSAC